MRKPRRGQALIEFAVAFPVVLLMLFALFDVTRLFFTQLSLDAGAQAACRLAAMNRPNTTKSQLYHAVTKAAPGVAISAANVSVGHVSGARGDDFVEVTVRGEYPLLSAFYVTRHHRIQMGSTSKQPLRTDLAGGTVHLP